MASSSQGVQSVSKKGAIWQDEEVDALIALCGEEDIQAKLERTTRSIKVFETISNKLKDLGFEGKTAVQCRLKVLKKLKADYRKTKAHNNRSGRNCKTSRYMDQLDSILGHRPASKPPVVFQSAQQEANSGEESDLEVQTGKEPLDTSAGIWSYYLLYLPEIYILFLPDTSLETTSTRDTSLGTSSNGDNMVLETLAQDEVSQEDAYGEGPSSSSKDCPSDREQPCNSKKATKRKQNRGRQQVDIDKIVSEFHEQRKESWEKFMQWEEKRMRVEAEEEGKGSKNTSSMKCSCFLGWLAL